MRKRKLTNNKLVFGSFWIQTAVFFFFENKKRNSTAVFYFCAWSKKYALPERVQWAAE